MQLHSFSAIEPAFELLPIILTIQWVLGDALVTFRLRNVTNDKTAATKSTVDA